MTSPEKTIEVPPDQALTRIDTGQVGQALPPDQIKAPITPAQAKVEAIANLTMQAYARAGMLVLTPEEITRLQADFPDSAFQPGAAGKEHLIYIEHAHLRDRFNAVFGPGQWAIIPRSRWAEPFVTQKGKEGSRVYVEAMLIVRGAFVAEAVGAMEYYPDNDAQNYGDAVEGAKTAALRRCAKELGVGLQAWKKDWCEGWWQRRHALRGQRSAPADPARQPPPQPPQPAPKAPPKPKDKQGGPMREPVSAELLRELRNRAGLFEPVLLRYLQNAPTRQSGRVLLMPNEGLEDLSDAEARALINHWEDLVPAVELWTSEHPAPTGPALPNEAWRMAIVPIPRKGMKRSEYLKAPDTLGSLYDASPTDEDARKRLFGLAQNFNVETSWTGNDGQVRPRKPEEIEADKRFRDALDAFMDWHDDRIDKESR